MRIRRSAITLGIAGLVAASLTGCSLFSGVAGTIYTQRTYASWNAASNALGSSLATFIPHDATALTLRWLTAGGGTILSYTSKTAPAATDCKAGALTGAPKADAQWWPEKQPAQGAVCASGWQVFQTGSTTYAWSSTSISS